MKNKSGFAPIVLLIIAGIVLVAGGAYYLGGRSKVVSPESVLTENQQGDKTEEGDAVPDVSGVYVYSGHGFSIELPKGFVPKEEQAENGPALVISLPAVSLSYTVNPSFWERSNIPSYTYVKDVKIGVNIFKVYTYLGVNLYWLKNGNVGYEFGGVDGGKIESLLKTFKLISGNTENSSQESFTNQPARIISISGDGKIFSLDILTMNPRWVPGGTENYYINQNSKIRELSLKANANIYDDCTQKNSLASEYLIKNIGNIANFDIEGSLITGAYQWCIP